MSTHDRHPFDREIAERLLRGAPGAAREARVLAQRLAAAAVPAFARELTGEQMAVAAFRSSAGLNVADQPGRPSMIKTTLAKLLTVKAAVILAGVSAGGVALAATTGALPNPVGENRPVAPHSTPGTDNPGQGTPSPSLKGLCTAFLAGAGAERGKALESPAFKALIKAAGGEDAVESYCTTLVDTRPGNSSTDHPAGPPTSLPGSAPPHPTGAPGTHPTGPASAPATPSHPNS